MAYHNLNTLSIEENPGKSSNLPKTQKCHDREDQLKGLLQPLPLILIPG